MSDQQNKAIVQRYFDDVRNQRNRASVSQIFADDVAIHVDTPWGDKIVRGIGPIHQALQAYLIAFPDLQFVIEDQIAEGDKVATHWRARGTHNGALLGHAPTGKQVLFGGTDIFRIANGRIAEGWTHYDRLVILQQIGAIPSPRQG